MPSVDGRIELWRRAIHLFHETKNPSWKGPFLRAGYAAYRVSPLLLDSEGANMTPDIVATSDSHWLAADLTLRHESKRPDLERYQTISASNLRNYGLPSDRRGPVLATVRPDEWDDGGFPQILVGGALSTRHADQIVDGKLREALAIAEGTDFEKLPEVPIAFIPESKAHEIRRGLVPIVMELFRPDRPAKTPIQIVDEGLERLAEVVTIGDKHGLATRVKREIDILLHGDEDNLANDVEFVSGAYQAKAGGPLHSRSMERITRILKQWSGVMRSLDEFMET